MAHLYQTYRTEVHKYRTCETLTFLFNESQETTLTLKIQTK